MKAIRNYLVLCLLLVMPLQSIAASFQLACQNNHKTSVTAETKMSHCHQTKEHKQSKEVQSHNASHHCVSACGQLNMAALSIGISAELVQFMASYEVGSSKAYLSVLLPKFYRPPIQIS
jgi:hypothetical protein